MTAGYLGSLGRLVPVYSTPGMSISAEVPKTYSTTLGGRRFVRSAPRGHREWSLTGAGGFANELAAVQGFADGDWGDGPFWWLSPWAAGVNVLTPGGSVLKFADLAGGTIGGPVRANDGTWFPVSAVTSGTVIGLARSASRNYVAVPKGVRYTASLYVSAGQRVRISEFDASLGAVLATAQSPTASGTGLSRVSLTATATANTDALRLDVVGAGVCAGAAITFTGDLAPWGKGDGCEAAVVDTASMDVRVVNTRGWADQSYTIKEVGS